MLVQAAVFRLRRTKGEVARTTTVVSRPECHPASEVAEYLATVGVKTQKAQAQAEVGTARCRCRGKVPGSWHWQRF